MECCMLHFEKNYSIFNHFSIMKEQPSFFRLADRLLIMFCKTDTDSLLYVHHQKCLTLNPIICLSFRSLVWRKRLPHWIWDSQHFWWWVLKKSWWKSVYRIGFLLWWTWKRFFGLHRVRGSSVKSWNRYPLTFCHTTTCGGSAVKHRNYWWQLQRRSYGSWPMICK